MPRRPRLTWSLATTRVRFRCRCLCRATSTSTTPWTDTRPRKEARCTRAPSTSPRRRWFGRWRSIQTTTYPRARRRATSPQTRISWGPTRTPFPWCRSAATVRRMAPGAGATGKAPTSSSSTPTAPFGSRQLETATSTATTATPMGSVVSTTSPATRWGTTTLWKPRCSTSNPGTSTSA